MKNIYLLIASMGIALSILGLSKIEVNEVDSTTYFKRKVVEPTRRINPPKKYRPMVLKPEAKESNVADNTQDWLSEAFLAPSITVSKSVTVQGGGNATPGGVLNYSISVNNTASGSANDATGVVVTDQLVNDLTLVSGSLKATPIATNDAYNCVGNVGITLPASGGVIINDANPIAANALTITAFDATSANGGTVTMTTSGANLGAFTYTPAAGFSGTDTFTYTIDNGSGITNTSRTATVTITVSTPIWFVNSTAGSGGNGTLSNPFQNWSDFAAANVGGAGKPKANDIIFISAGNSPYTYTGTATLLAGQKVLGEGATVSLATFAGVTVPSYTSLPLPTTGGNKPNLTSIGTTITLGTNNTLRGFDMGSSTKDIVGSSFGTLTISEMALSGSGAALDLTTGTLAATFTSIASTNAASTAINLNSVSGNLTSTGGTTITNPTGQGIAIIGSSTVTSNFGNTIVNGSSAAGILLTSGSSINTTFGSLNIAPDANQNAISGNGNSGTITCTSGTLTNTGITCIGFIGLSSSAKLNLNMTLTSVSSSGGSNGIVLTNTAGSLTITGTGTTAGSGGTIQNTSQAGINLNNASGISLNYMNITNTGRSCISATNLSGTCAINNSTLSMGASSLSATGYDRRCVHILNENVAMTLNVNGSTFTGQLTTSPDSNHGIAYESTSAANSSTVGTLNIKNSTFNRFNNYAVYTTSTGSAITDVGIQGSSVNYDGGTGFVGGAFHLYNLRSAKTTFNILNNTSILTKGGLPIEFYTTTFDGTDFNPASGRGMEGKFNGNTLTRHSSDAGVGVNILVKGRSNMVVQVSNNIITKGSLSLQAVENTPESTIETPRLDATVTNNTIEELISNYGIDVLSGGPSATGFSTVINCVKISGNNITPRDASGLGLIRFFTNGPNAGGGPNVIWLDGANGTAETSLVNYWNNNSNTPTGVTSAGPTRVRDAGFGGTGNKIFRAAGTCLTPTNAAPARIAVEDYAKNNQSALTDSTLAFNEISEETPIEEPLAIEEKEVVKTEISSASNTENSSARLLSGEQILVNGSGSGFALPAGKSTTITFSATISNTPSSCTITNQASASGSNFTTVNSNTTNTSIVVPPPTGVTPSGATSICIGQSVSLVATCTSGNVQWYNAAATSTLLGTSTSLGTFTQSPTGNITYQAACLVGGCESTRVNTGLITVNQLPTISVSVSPAICEGATSFTIPYTGTTNSPTTYSISGTGITTVTNAALPATPITVNLSSPATGSSYSYTLTVRNANGCVSNTVTGNVSVNPVPTITTGTSPAICAGATSFTIPYSATTGTPTTYSISGVGITSVTNATLNANSITVNLSSGASGSSISYTLTVRNAAGCTSSNVLGSVTVNPLPTLTTSASPAICAGATSFTIPYTATTGTPTTYSISGAGITTVTDGALTATPITVNLSSGASGTSISYILTVKNANGCTSNNITGNVTVNALPTLTKSASPAICEGATTFTIPYTATTGTPTTYSISGTGITSVTDATLPATPITVSISDAGGATGSSYSYILTVKNANGCTSSNITGSVTVNSTPAPINPTATPSTFTVPGTTSLTASGCNSPSTISWYDAANSTVPLPNSTPAISSNKTFFARCTGTNGCISQPSANVVVNYNPCTPSSTSPGNVNIIWTGLVGTNWNDACNWNQAWVPDLSNAKVIIPNTTNKPVISSSIPDVKAVEIQSGGTLTINTGQTLNIRGDGGTSKGLHIIGGTVTNNGTINIESGTNTAIPAYIYLQSGNAVLTNNGTMRINSTDEAIGVGLVSTPATITNSSTGIINVVNGIGVEIALPSDAVNFNNAGTINYDGSVLAFKFLGTTNFTNTGTVNINSGTGIENPTGNTITNNACSRIFMATGTYTNTGTTTNAGLIQLPNSYSFTNTGTFTNNGVVKANAVSGITNNKMVITNACPIFTLGGSNNYTVSGIFTDAGATTSAGTYTSTGNKFTANNTIPAGSQTLYARVSDGTCTFTVPFDFNNAKPSNVSISTTSTCVGSSVTLSATCTSGTVTWYGSAAGTTSLGSGGTFAYVPSAGTGQSFYASCENGTPPATTCSSGRTITSNFLNVYTIPEAPNVTPPTTLVVCSPSTLTLTASGCAGTVTWSQGGSTGTTLTLSDAGTYSISATCTINGCTSAPSKDVGGLEIKAKPNAPTITPPTSLSVCSPSTLTLTASGCAGTVTWSQGGSTGTTLTLLNVGTYSVSATCTVNGCTSDASTTVTGLEIKAKPNAPTITPPTTLVVCSPSTLALTASGCAGTVTWSQGGSTGTSLTLSTVGTYTISATCTVNGCTSDASSTVTGLEIKAKPNAPTITPPTSLSVCSPSTLILTASGCAGTVTWSQGGSTGTSLTLLNVGTYSVSATCTVNGCTSDASTTVTGLEIKAKPNAPTIIPPATLVVCSPSTLTLTATGCAGTVTWSQGGSTGTSLTLSTVGTYAISATCTVNGCTSDASSTVTGLEIKAKPNAPTITPPTSLSVCSPSTLTLTASGCAGTVTWSQGGSTGTTLTLLNVGTYSVSATCTVNGCTSDASATVNGLEIKAKPNAPTITPPTTLVVCSPSTLTLTASGCAGTVTWSQGGSTGTSLTLSTVGTYAISATCTVNGCTSDASATVTGLEIKAKPNAPTITPPTSLSVCSPSTLILTASGCAGTVTWSQGGSTGTTLTLLNIGTYSVSATCTVNGCTSDASATVNGLEIKAKPNAPTITPPTTLVVCSPSMLTLSASGCAGTVTWSQGGSTGTTLTLSAVGTYSVSATCTVNGCTSDASTSATGMEIKAKPNAPTITPPTSLSVCSPSTLTLTASGCAGTVTWSQGGSTGTTLTLLNVGTYSVSATCTVNGCTSDASATVNGLEIKAKPNAPTITPPTTLVVCSPEMLTLTASGCAGTVTWSQGGSTGTSLTLSTVGTYAISATCTVNGCTSDASSTVTGLEIKAKPNAPTITPPTSLSVCSPSTLTLTASGCAGTVTWSQGGSTGTSLTLLNVGTYSVSATCTVNECTSDASTTVTGLEIKAKPNAPTITPPTTLVVCSPETLTLTASGCAGTISWSQGGSTGTTLTLSAVGTYSISATCTVNGCTSDASTTVTGLEIKAKPNAPTITPPTSLSVCSPSTLILTASGCAGTVTWSQGGSTGTTLTLANVGTYSVSATCTVNGCTSDASTTVTGLEIKAKPNAPTIIPPTTLVVCSPETLTLTATGCAGMVTWSQGGSTGTTLTLSTVGTYSISATCTVNGCTSDASSMVTGLEIKAKPNAPTITPPTSLSVCSPSMLTLTASGCVGTVTWSQGSSTGTSLTLSTVGTYSVSATCTVNGCTSDASATVNGLEIKAKPIAPTITPPTTLVVCSPSTLTLTASGCAGTVTWSQGGSTGTSLTLSTVGTYSVSATCTVNGCTSDASSTVTGLEIKALPIITASNTGPYTVGQSINLIGTGVGSYSWSGPNNFSSTLSSPIITNALSVNGGIYTLSVTGINGCNAIATTNVIVSGVDPCDPSRVVDYSYVKAGNPYQTLFPLTNGMTINQRPDQVSILVNPVCPSVPIESFEMNIQGPELNWNILQNVAPYALFDNVGNDVWGRNFKPGVYTLTVTGYAQDNKGGAITYGPKVVTFTVVGNLATINAPTLSKTTICAGSSVDVSFTTTGTFNGVNQFQVELSDSSGSFNNPVLIGTTNTVGTLSCMIPQNTVEGSKYLVRVSSTNQVVVSNPAMDMVTVHPLSYTLVNPTNNLTGTSSKKAVNTINASNKVTSPANVTYQAGKSILLTPGFESGAVFKAEIQGCN